MVIAEEIYVDPSALRALYVADPRSLAMGRWRARIGGSVPITRFSHVELVNAIALGQFRGDYGEANCVGALEDVRSDLEAGRLHLVDLPWRAALDVSQGTSIRWSAQRLPHPKREVMGQNTNEARPMTFFFGNP